MYLNRQTHFTEPHTKINTAPHIKAERVNTITEGVGYWRKANQIHNWFVLNIQNGIDDCREYDVDEEMLKDLLKLVKSVLKEPYTANEKLPTIAGFFFGEADYGEYYMSNLKQTRDMLTDLFKEKTVSPERKHYVTYTYQSSW